MVSRESLKLEFLTPRDMRWAEFLSKTSHQFYHLPGYAELWARHDRGEAEAVLVTKDDDYFFLPYSILRLEGIDGLDETQKQFHDLRSPYGYPGPLIRAEAPAFLSQALGEWIEAMRKRRIVSGFFRLDPLAHIPSDVFAEHGQVCQRGETVSIDLTLDEAALRAQFRPSVRQNIRRNQAAGLVAKKYPYEKKWEVFQTVYYEAMDRVGAAPGYYFSAEHFHELASLLGDHLEIWIVESTTGEALVAGLFVAYGGTVQYHLAGTRTAALSLKPTELLIASATQDAKARGNHTLHLGGGRGAAADSLFNFKAGFSKRRHRFATLNFVFLADAYQSLLVQRQKAAQNDVADERAEFFPAYRS